MPQSNHTPRPPGDPVSGHWPSGREAGKLTTNDQHSFSRPANVKSPIAFCCHCEFPDAISSIGNGICVALCPVSETVSEQTFWKRFATIARWINPVPCLGAQLAISAHRCPVRADLRFPMSSFKRTQRKYVKKAYRVRN
jgi:hypothetical protein